MVGFNLVFYLLLYITSRLHNYMEQISKCRISKQIFQIVFSSDTPDKLRNDKEIKSWRIELGKKQENGGCGITVRSYYEKV